MRDTSTLLSNSAHVAQPGKPKITRTGVFIVLMCWIAYSVLYTLPIVAAGQEDRFTNIMFSQIIHNLFMAVLSIGPWWVIVRGMDGRKWWERVLAHAIALPLYVWIGGEILLFFVGQAPDPEVLAGIEEVYPFILAEKASTYVVQFSLYHMVLFFQRMRLREHQTIALSALARERELMALRAQINPHFLFNTLNTISALAGEDAEATRSTIARLADMMRYALDSSKRDLVLLEEEVGFTKAYLDIESQRMGERLKVNIDIPPEARTVMVPPILLQPLVENAVKHGLAPSEIGGGIHIRAQIQGSRFLLEVEDNGAGDLGGSSKSGVGLANTRARLANRFGEEASLETTPLEPNGFKATVKIPLP